MYHDIIQFLGGGELCVLARHHKMYKLVNGLVQSNIPSCSRALSRAAEEQAKQLNIHMRGESST
jgi:hypothetical protein